MIDTNQACSTPQLDALLKGTLRSRRLTARQREGHVRRLGIAADGQAQRATISPSAPHSMPFPDGGQPVDNSEKPRSYRREWLELAGACLTVVVVGGLLALVFRGTDDGRQPGVGEAATGGDNHSSLLFVASHVSVDRSHSISTIGRVRAYDVETGDERYAFDVGPRIDMALAPDGEALVVAGSNVETGTDDLVAYDPATGQERWRVVMEDRAWWKLGGGTSALAFSPDGRELYVYSCSACTGQLRMGNGGDHWLQVLDAASGEKLRDVPVATCSENRDMGVQLHVSPDGGMLFVVCLDTGTISAVGLSDGVVMEKLPGIGARIAGSASSTDGRELFILSYADGIYSVAVIDAETHGVTRQRSMIHADATSRLLPLIALSNDGERLIVGIDDRPNDNEAAAYTLYTFNPQALQPEGEIDTAVAIDAHPPVAADDGSLLVLSRELSPENTFRHSVVRVSFNGVHDQIASFDREEVIVMRAGPIPLVP